MSGILNSFLNLGFGYMDGIAVFFAVLLLPKDMGRFSKAAIVAFVHGILHYSACENLHEAVAEMKTPGGIKHGRVKFKPI